MVLDSILNSFLTFLETNIGIAYFLLFFFSFLEIFIFSSFFLYGEIIFLAGGILGGMGILNIWIVSILSILGGILGDFVNFYLGKFYGKKLIHHKNRYFNPTNFAKTKKIIDKHGDKAVFLARFSGPLAWVTPFIVGMSNFEVKRFAIFNIPAAILGIGQFLLIGYLISHSYQKLLPLIGEYSLLFLGSLLIIILLIYLLRKYLFKLKILFFKYNSIILEMYFKHILSYTLFLIILVILLIFLF